MTGLTEAGIDLKSLASQNKNKQTFDVKMKASKYSLVLIYNMLKSNKNNNVK